MEVDQSVEQLDDSLVRWLMVRQVNWITRIQDLWQQEQCAMNQIHAPIKGRLYGQFTCKTHKFARPNKSLTWRNKSLVFGWATATCIVVLVTNVIVCFRHFHVWITGCWHHKFGCADKLNS